MLEVGKLYRHHMIRSRPGARILGCIMHRDDNGKWNGNILTVQPITDNAGSMIFIEMYENDILNLGKNNMGIFLAGDRFVMVYTDLVEAI